MSQAGQLEVATLKAAIAPFFSFVYVCERLCLFHVYVWVSVRMETRG